MAEAAHALGGTRTDARSTPNAEGSRPKSTTKETAGIPKHLQTDDTGSDGALVTADVTHPSVRAAANGAGVNTTDPPHGAPGPRTAALSRLENEELVEPREGQRVKAGAGIAETGMADRQDPQRRTVALWRGKSAAETSV